MKQQLLTLIEKYHTANPAHQLLVAEIEKLYAAKKGGKTLCLDCRNYVVNGRVCLCPKV